MHAAVDAAYDDPAVARAARRRSWPGSTPAGLEQRARRQAASQLTMPGVPDVYQGTELWEQSLVDPDNRRPVDFDVRRGVLAACSAASARAHTASTTRRARSSWSPRRALPLRRDRPRAVHGVRAGGRRGRRRRPRARLRPRRRGHASAPGCRSASRQRRLGRHRAAPARRTVDRPAHRPGVRRATLGPRAARRPPGRAADRPVTPASDARSTDPLRRLGAARRGRRRGCRGRATTAVVEMTTGRRRLVDAGRSAVPDAERRSTTASCSTTTSTPRPDPRSRRQPDGVHERSRTYDPAAFALDRPGAGPGASSPGAVIYELHVGTFTPEGTLDAAIDRLDHLVELGVDLVELMPVNAFNGAHNWGYDGVRWFAVTRRTAARRRTSASSTPATPPGSASCRTSSTTTSARRATTCRCSGRTSRPSGATPGATWSTSTARDRRRCAASSSTTR